MTADLPRAGWILVLLTLAAGGAAAAEAGRFQFVVGQVSLSSRDGPSRPAAKGDRVQEGDLVRTGPGASAQLRMADEGLVAIRPDSSLRIDAFRFPGREDGSERSVLALIRGGLRTLTGLIGRSRKDAYLVRTPTATIGIRGTDHEPVFVPTDGWSGAPGADPGTYDKVNAGATYIETGGGRVDLEANDVGFVPPRTDALPVRLDRMPEFLRAAPGPHGRPEGRGVRPEAAGDRQLAAAAKPLAAAAIGAQRGIEPAADAPTGVKVPAADVLTAGGGLTAAPRGLAVAGADQYVGGHVPGSGAGINEPGDLTVLRDAAGQIGVVGSSEGFRYSRGDARLVHSGATTITDGDTEIPVRWGIYAGGHIVDRQGERSPRFMSVIAALPATSDGQLTALSGLGSRTFSLQAAGKPVNGAGLVGGDVRLATVTVDFARLAVADAHLRVVDAQGFVFDGAAKGPMPLAGFARGGIPLAVSLTTPDGGSFAPRPDLGHLHGVLVGPSARGMIGGYDMHLPTATDPRSVAGVVVLGR